MRQGGCHTFNVFPALTQILSKINGPAIDSALLLPGWLAGGRHLRRESMITLHVGKPWDDVSRSRGVGGHVTPQTGAAGIPEAARAFTCVNLLRGSGLDFPCVRPVFVRKREDRSGCASRKHVDFAGLPDRPCERGAPSVAVAVKGLRCAPMNAQKRASLTAILAAGDFQL